MMKKVVLLSCGKKKLKTAAMARDLYIGDLFVKSMKYAEKLAPDAIRILSAKYGLLKPEQWIEPYEKTLNTMRVDAVKRWSDDVLSALQAEFNLRDTKFIILAGEKYRNHLTPHMPHHQIPLSGLKFGQQLQALGRLLS